ncbi:MAG: 5'-nucleotidase C-terminal domain-containing protein [Armatimonadetes bacterium]|nr:5'-nucleotidase C-terminal domain-containing protein [Armatimonadota bacterium]
MRARLIVGAVALALVSLAHPFTLSIVHTNDVHARVEPATIKGKPYGGYARVATLFNQLRKKDPNTLFLNAGDTFQGTLYYNVYKGTVNAHLMNLLGYSAMEIGNHEFDDGPAGLAPFVKSVQFPVVCANLDFSQDPDLRGLVQPYTVLKAGKESIGVIGVITPELFSISGPGDKIKMLDLDKSIESAIESLEAQKINKIILLSHCGYGEDKEIAAKHPKLDLIVGGHSHSFLGDLKLEGFPRSMGPYPTMVGKVVVVQAWEWAKIVGHLVLDFDNSGNLKKVRTAETIPVDESIAPDPMVESAIAAFRKPIEALQTQVVGLTESGLSREGAEMPLGNVICDSMVAATAKQGVVLALMNRGGIRASLEPGKITYGAAISVQPFNNTLVILDLKGSELKQALEDGFTKGYLTQVSAGVQYQADMSKPANSRLVSVSLGGKPIDDLATYRIVTNNFMAKGGDEYNALANAKGYRYDTGLLDIDALLEYLKAHNPIEAKAEGRISTK